MKPQLCMVIALLSAVSGLARAGEVPTEGENGRLKVAVLDLQAQTPVAKGVLKMLNELLLTEVQETGNFEVLGSSDITNMMSLEEERVKLTGCADDSCLAEIGGALGVQLLVAAYIGALGDSYLVSLKFVDVREAKVLKRVAEMVEGTDKGLAMGIKIAVKKAIAGTSGALKMNLSREEEGSSEFLELLPWLAVGLTGALGVTAAILAGVAYSDHGTLTDEVKGTSDWKQASDGVESKSVAADVLFGLTAAAAVGTLVLFLVDLDGGDEGIAAGVLPTRGGAAATLGFRFR